MENWPELFDSYQNSAVYSADSDMDAHPIKKAASACGLAFFQIDLEDVNSKTDFLKKISKGLSFPEYFGMNWDALSDCLTDMSWKPSGGYVLFFSGFSQFVERRSADAEVAVHLFDSCISYWKQKQVPFFIVIADCVKGRS